MRGSYCVNLTLFQVFLMIRSIYCLNCLPLAGSCETTSCQVGAPAEKSSRLTVCVCVSLSLSQLSVWRAAARGTETAPNLASVCKY